MSRSESIVLRDVEGMARKSGTDQHGCQWIEFEVDYFAEQEDGECSICGETISSGWTCLDGGDEVCDEHIAIETAPEYGDFEHIRTWRHSDYRLELYDTYQMEDGKSTLAYQFFYQGRLVFIGADFSPSPMDAIDSDYTIASLLGFLSLRPGDTDSEYFEDYTPEQLEFAQQEGENLSSIVYEMEE